MDDLNFDRELKVVLDAAPSPDFLARTRTKVAEQSQQRRPMRWLMPLAVGAAIAAVAVVVNLTPSRTFEPQAKLFVLASRPVETRVAPLPNVASRRPATPVVSRASAPAVTVDADLPFVLIAESDKRAFDQLVAALYRQPLEASFDQIPAPEHWLNTELTVAPITIPPLEPSAAAQNN